MLNTEDKEFLLHLARSAIEEGFGDSVVKLEHRFKEKYGVFITLTINNQLRGCIGYPDPIFPLEEAIVNAAKAAAFKDPRFTPLTKDELEKVEIEISLLTKPQRIRVEKPEEYVKEITLGTDGIIAEYGLRKGLLLPQVAVEQKMSKEEFLSHSCLKAGLPQNHWIDNNCKIYKFQAEVFHE
jgi:AmmeMemoRadiSam system protein A